jgi:CheY-like chemotaxis protein
MILKLRSLRDKNVLIVEDEYVIALDLEHSVRKHGANVVGPASSVDEALELIAHTHVDCAVLDINLQGERVYAVADSLRNAGIPYVFATGYDAPSIPAGYENVPCICKPFDPEVVTSILRG